jgi:hypothetical protein
MPARTDEKAPRDQTPLSAAKLVESIQEFLERYPEAALLEDGRVLFDMRVSRYSVAETNGRCVLQLWNDERNLVRTVISAESRNGSLRVMTRKLGAPRPVAIDFTGKQDRRAPTERDKVRRQYLRLLERVLERSFPDAKLDGFRTATDLEHSFGPAYVRGHLFQGISAEAVIGVGCDESPAAIDGILTLGLLWLDYCREHSVQRRAGPVRHFGALKVIVPAGTYRTNAERMLWLNQGAAAFQLFTLDERSEELTEIDFRDTGNVDSRLVRAFDASQTRERAQGGIDRIRRLVPARSWSRVEIRAQGAAEVGLLLHGLEFARIRTVATAHSFAREQEITFGAGANETRLSDETESLCTELLAQLFVSRHPDGERPDPLFRLQPERWLESQVRIHLEEMLPGLRGEFLYSQVPAIGAGERGMLDLLTLDRSGRLVILEVKADEDMHLPLQGLDYWIRVRALNEERLTVGNRSTGAFERQGYFVQDGVQAEVGIAPPKLLLIAPALRIHPSNEIVLRYLSPQVDWELIAVSEHWRRELKVVFRKRSREPFSR